MDFAKDILSVKKVCLIKHFRKIKSVSNNFTRLIQRMKNTLFIYKEHYYFMTKLQRLYTETDITILPCLKEKGAVTAEV